MYSLVIKLYVPQTVELKLYVNFSFLFVNQKIFINVASQFDLLALLSSTLLRLDLSKYSFVLQLLVGQKCKQAYICYSVQRETWT